MYDISCKYIPEDSNSYNIQFHKDIILPSLFDKTDEFYRNCYVNIEECNSAYDKKKGYIKRVGLVFPVYKKGLEYESLYDYITLVFKDENQKVSEWCSNVQEEQNGRRWGAPE